MEAAEPPSTQVKYEIEVTQGDTRRTFDTGFHFLTGEAAAFQVPIEQGLPRGTWAWRARAVTVDGAASAWSETHTFTAFGGVDVSAGQNASVWRALKSAGWEVVIARPWSGVGTVRTH